MSADKVRKLLVSLQDDPESAKAWSALEELALDGELAALGAEFAAQLAEERRRFLVRGECEAAAKLLDVEAMIAASPEARASLLRERAFVLEEELLDDRAAVATLDALLSQGDDPEAASERARLLGKKGKWKDLVGDYRRRAENDTTDPAVIASLLVSAAALVLQYKNKLKDRDVDSIFEEALQIDPSNLRAIQLYERILRRRGTRWDDVARVLEAGAEAVTDPDERSHLLLRAARVHAGRRSDMAGAERCYRRLLQLDPRNADAMRFLGVILQDSERWDDLVQVYESALAAEPGRPDVGLLVQVAMTHWRMRNDPAAAEPFFARLQSIDPAHPAAANFFAERAEPDAEVSFDAGSEEEVDAYLDENDLEVSNTVPPGAFDPAAFVPEPVAAGPVAVVPEPVAVASEPEPVAVEPVAVEPMAVAAEPVAVASEPEPVAVEPVAVAPESDPVVKAPSRPAEAATRSVAPGALGARVQQALEMAQAAEAAGQLDRAIDAWKAVLRQDPDHPEARPNLVRLYTTSARWNNLVELYRQELEALGGVRPGPDLLLHKERKLEVLRAMVEVYRDKLSLEPMVVQTYNALLGLEPGDREALAALVQSYERLGRYTDVIKVLDQQVQYADSDAERVGLLRRIAQLWIERFNNVNNATRPLEQIVELDPSDVDALGQLKELYTKRRAWRPLFEVSRREAAMLQGTARRDALVELARLAAEKLSANTEAIGLWREALEIDRETPGALDALERLTDREKDWVGLGEVLERRVEEADDPEQKVAVLMKLGVVYGERLEDPARAIDAWKRLLATRPGHPKALRVLRDAYVQASNWDELEALYGSTDDWEGLADVLGQSADKATDPAAKVALSFRAARVYEERLGQPARAFRSYERVLSVEPDNLAATRALVPIYLHEERWPRLAQLFEVLLNALDPADVDGAIEHLLRLREIAATRLGDRPAAFQWALRAYTLRPESPEIEANLEASAAAAGSWQSLVDTYDARARSLHDPAEQARLRDKAAAIEADKLGALDAAVARYQAALAASPDDPHVIDTLDRLLRQGGQWSDLRALYDHRLSRAQDPGSRRSLRFEAARIEEDFLGQPDAASERYRAVLADDPADPEALEALSQLAQTAERWAELAALMAIRRDLAEGPARAELAYRLGALKVERLDDKAGAVAAFREALGLVAHHGPSLGALEALLRDEAWRVPVAEILEPEFAQTGDHARLAWVLQILLEAAASPASRRALALRLARVYAEQLDDVRQGFELLRTTLGEQPDSEEVADVLAELALAGGWGEEFAAGLAEIARRPDLAEDVRVRLARRAAAVYDERLDHPVAAEPFHRMVIDAGGLDPHAFGALRRLYQDRERWDDLRSLYAVWVDRCPEPSARIELLLEEALLLEEILDLPAEAAAVYGRVLGLDPRHEGAARALDRLLVRLGRWVELDALLCRRLDLGTEAPEDARELQFRRGEVRERQLGEGPGALGDYAAVVGQDPTHAGARAGLERLLEVPSLRAEAGAVLEGLYEADGDAGAQNLVRMLLVRLEGTEAPGARAELLRRVADQRELVLRDASGAFDAITLALAEEPGSDLLRDELLRLSTVAAQDARAAEALERAAVDPRVGAAQVAVLRDLANLYDDRLFDHVKAEQTFRRLLAVAPDDTEVVSSAALALERLYRGLQNPRGLVEALSLRAEHEPDPVMRRSLLAQAAEILEDELGDLPGALQAQRARLEIDPTDREALKALARLYEKTEGWPDLVATLRQDAALTDDPEGQKALLVQAAAVLEARIADIPAAVTLYREVLDAHGPDRTIHAALTRLYELSDAWPALVSILEQDLAAATEDDDRLAIIVRLGETRRVRTREPLVAVEHYREALSLDPVHPTARAALEGLLADPNPGVALAAGRALDPVLQAENAWDKLVAVLDRVAADTDDPDERRQAYARGADVCEIGLNDPARAFDRAALELRESLHEPEVSARLARVEELARAAGRHADLVATLEIVAPDLLDPTLQREVLMKVASVAQHDLGDLVKARAYYEKALDQQPDYAPALDALEALHEASGAWSELLAVVRRKTELAADSGAQKALLRKQAAICEGRLHDRAAAVRAHEAILDHGFDREATLALERLYAAEGRWEDLASLLEGQLPQDGADVADLHFRLGSVAMDHLNDADRALDHFHEVLERQPDHEATVTSLERLGARTGYAARTAAMLEPIYRRRMDTPKLIAALEARIAAEGDVHARKALLGSLGTLYEETVGDLDKALETYARVFREELGDRETWEVLTRLARSTDKHGRLAEIYAAALETVTVDDDDTAELSFLAGSLFDTHVGDPARARVWYRRALAFDPGRAEVFAALEALLLRSEAWDELLGLYRDAADRADAPDERKGYLFKIAVIDEDRRGDLARAIEDYRAILDTDPADTQAVERLDALLVRTEAWPELAELLDRRIADAADPEARATFRFRLGKLRVERLDDPRGAVESFREILDERRDHKEAVRALEAVADANPGQRLSIVEILEPIYRELDDWRRLVVALNLRLAASEDPIERGQLLREIGTLKEVRDGDVTAAFAAFSQAFAADPADGEAREAAERLAAEHSLWDDLVTTYETALAATDDTVVQTDLLRAIASTHDQRRDDPRSAIDAYNRLFAIDETQLDVLDLLENLHVLLSDWEGHVEVLERKVARSLDDEIRTFLLRQIGEQQRDMLNDPDKAIDAFRRALDIDPGDVASLEALDGLYVSRRDIPRLAEVLQQRLDIEPDVEVRRVTALRLGKLWEIDLGDPQRAVDAYRRVLDDVPDDREALGALERLYERQQSWSDLLENLRTQSALAADDQARTPLRLRIGALLAERLQEPEAALESYREVLEVEPGNAVALAAVRSLADDEGQRAGAVEILEPLFRSAHRWDDLVAIVELKLTGIEDPSARLAELKALAQVHESGRGDLAMAFATWRRALHEDPSDFDARMELERLSGALQRWSDLVEVLEEEAAATGDPTVGGELSVRAAEIARDRLEDDARAVRGYRRALDIAGDTEEVLEALDALHGRNAQWPELLEVLERRVTLGAPESLDALEVRVAELREKRFEDGAGALTAYRNVLDRTPTSPEALAGVERLLAQPSVRPDALEVLEASYLRNDDVQRLAWLTELRVGDADLDADKVRLLGDLARLREDRLGDVRGALDAQVRAFGVDPRDEQTLLELERLAPAAGAWDRLRGVAEEALERHALDPMDAAALNLRAARWYLDHLGDPASAEERLLATLAADPENLDALELLEGVRRGPGREADLVATLRRRAELELDIDARKRMLREAADLAETRLHDLDEAAALSALLLDIDEADTEALDALARLRRAQGRHADVADLLARRARITDDPTRAVALRREVAELYAGPLDDIDRAVAAWRDLLDFEPNDLAARQSLEALLSRAERWRDLDDALRSRLDAALSTDERAAVRLELARLHETRFSDLATAADFLRDVLDEVPTHVAAGNELERIYSAERRWSDLGELLERRADDYASAGDIGNELTILVRIGELSERELGDTARAVELYERVLARDPDHVGALRALSRLAEGASQWDRAKEMLSRALALSPSGPEGAALALHLARIQSERGGDLDAAQVTLFRALELDPTHAESLAALKDLAARKHDDRLLATAIEREVAVVPDPKQKVLLLKNLAQLGRDRLRDEAAALRWLEQAQSLDGDDREVLLPLVDLYSSAGREGDAIPIIERIIASFGTRRSKELAQWQHRLGRAYEAGGDDLRALSLYDQAFKIDLTNVPILRDLGLLCLKTGDLERAQKTFRALLLQRLDPSHGLTKADVYYHLGDTLHQQGDKAKAVGMLERAVDSDKTHARASALLAQLKS